MLLQRKEVFLLLPIFHALDSLFFELLFPAHLVLKFLMLMLQIQLLVFQNFVPLLLVLLLLLESELRTGLHFIDHASSSPV